jgi:AraC-like DNA-binding protein
VYLSPLALEQYEQLFRQWLRMISGPMVEAEQCLDTWIHLLTLFILQHQTSLPTGVTVVSSADYIKNSLHSQISMSELAKRCGLSESAFRTSFKKTFGVSPKFYQQTCRLSEAKWLLRSTDRPIQQVAQRVGFTGIHAFSAWFQKLEAISPKDWRKGQQSI